MCITSQIKVGPQNSQLQHSFDHIPYLPALAYFTLTPHISQFLKHTKRIPTSWFLSCAFSWSPKALSCEASRTKPLYLAYFNLISHSQKDISWPV